MLSWETVNSRLVWNTSINIKKYEDDSYGSWVDTIAQIVKSICVTRNNYISAHTTVIVADIYLLKQTAIAQDVSLVGLI